MQIHKQLIVITVIMCLSITVFSESGQRLRLLGESREHAKNALLFSPYDSQFGATPAHYDFRDYLEPTERNYINKRV